MDSKFPPIAELLPHRGRAVMLDAVLAHSENSILASAHISRAHPFFIDGHGVPAWVGIEFMAQAAAAHAGLASRRAGAAPRMGMLLGTRRYEMHTDYFTEDMQLKILAEREFGDSRGVGACRCSIAGNGRILANATLIIIETSGAPAP